MAKYKGVGLESFYVVEADSEEEAQAKMLQIAIVEAKAADFIVWETNPDAALDPPPGGSGEKL